MATSPEELRDAALEFIALIEEDGVLSDDRSTRLRRSLDRLAFVQHGVDYTFDKRDYPDTPRRDYNALRGAVVARFPELGYYNIPNSVTQQITETRIDVADAIDDITDIAIELYDVLWRFEHTSVDDALWYFCDSYLMHWEQHLRDLQLSLQRITAGHEDAV